MRLVYFCTSGAMSLLPLQALINVAQILAIVRPASRNAPGRQWLGHLARRVGLRQPDPIDRLARARRLPVLRASSGRDAQLLTHLQALRPEVICISTFRWLLAPDIVTLPTRGTINLHPSLLPRHRGPVPLFWIYYHNDHHTGVTIHRVSPRADAGEIMAQAAFPIPRGFSVEQLNHTNASHGAALLAQTVKAMEHSDIASYPQDEALATYAPIVQHGASMVRYDTWEVERVWHFLAGLWPRFREPLLSPDGSPVLYSQVLGYTVGQHRQALGSLRPRSHGWDLHCLHGWVHLAVPAQTAW